MGRYRPHGDDVHHHALHAGAPLPPSLLQTACPARHRISSNRDYFHESSASIPARNRYNRFADTLHSVRSAPFALESDHTSPDSVRMELHNGWQTYLLLSFQKRNVVALSSLLPPFLPSAFRYMRQVATIPSTGYIFRYISSYYLF